MSRFVFKQKYKRYQKSQIRKVYIVLYRPTGKWNHSYIQFLLLYLYARKSELWRFSSSYQIAGIVRVMFLLSKLPPSRFTIQHTYLALAYEGLKLFQKYLANSNLCSACTKIFHFFKSLNSLQKIDLQERDISVYVLYPSIKLVLLSHINENVLMDAKETCGNEECSPDKYEKHHLVLFREYARGLHIFILR